MNNPIDSNYSTFMNYPSEKVGADLCSHCYLAGGKTRKWVLLVNETGELNVTSYFSIIPHRFPFHEECAINFAKETNRTYQPIAFKESPKNPDMTRSEAATFAGVAAVGIGGLLLLTKVMVDAGIQF